MRIRRLGLGRLVALSAVFIGGLMGAIALGGCGESSDAGGASSGGETAGGSAASIVYTTFYPTEYFARRIAGDAAEVVCPVPDGADPATWRPSRDEIARYRDADLIVINGAEFERWVKTASLPPTRVVDTTASFEDEFVTYETVTHSHGPGGEHTHEGIDGHTWLDPMSAKRQAEAILRALIQALPESERRFREGFIALREDLDALDARFREVSAVLGDRRLLCAHPAYNYLARRYAWNVKNFDLNAEGALSAATLAELAGEAPAILLWESDPLASTTRALADAGVIGATFSPCELLGAEQRRSGEDYLSVMRANLDALAGAIEALDTADPEAPRAPDG